MINGKAIVIVGTKNNFKDLQKYLFNQGLKWWATKDNNYESYDDNYNSIIVREFLEGEGLEMALCDGNKITKTSMKNRNIEHKLNFDSEEDKEVVVEWIKNNF